MGDLLSDPGTIAVVFWLLLSLEVGWTAWQVIATTRRRQSLLQVLSGMSPPGLERWLRAWGRHDEQGKPQVEGGKLVLSGSPPELRLTAATGSPMAVAPGLLTALGVLGTFLGIHAGLSSIDLGALGSTEALLTAARGLLAGMTTAFATSVAGLMYAAIVMVILVVGRIVRHQWAKAEQARWRGMLTEAGQDSLTDAAVYMSTAIATLSENMTSIFGQMETQLAQLAQLRSEQGESMIREVIIEFREQALDPLAARLDESAAISRRSAEAVEKLEASLGGISQKLAGSVKLLEKFNRETHEKLQAFSDALTDTLTHFQTDTRQMLTETGAAIQDAVSASIEGMGRQREAFEQSATQAAETFRGIRTDLEAALTTQSDEQRKTLTALKDANIAILDRAEQAYTKQADAIEAIGAQAAATLQTARVELETSLAAVRKAIQETSAVVQEELSRFREEYNEHLRTFLAEQSRQLDEVLDRQRRGLLQVVERLESSFIDEYGRRKELSAEVEATIRQLKEGVETLDRLAQSLGLHSEARLAQLIELSRQMTGQTTGLESAYRDLSSQYDRSLASAISQIESYLDRFTSRHESALHALDDSSAKLTEGLYRAADVLVTASTARRTA